MRSGDLGTVTGIGQDNAMTVKLDSGKTAEVSAEKTKHIEYGYAVHTLKNIRAERAIATGDGLAQQAFQAAFFKADLALYTSSPQQQDLSPAQQLAPPEIARAAEKHDFGMGF